VARKLQEERAIEGAREEWQGAHQRSRSHSRVGTPALEPACSRPYTPMTIRHLQPSSLSLCLLPPHHQFRHLCLHHQVPPVTIHLFRSPLDNWIPHAQDATGDGRLSIFLPPPHELAEPVGVPEGLYAIATTAESGSPTVVPPPPDLPHSPQYVYVTPPPPDLGPSVRTSKCSRNRNHVYLHTPPPPDLGPAIRARDYANAPLPPPPPPDLGPASNERTYPQSQRIAKIASNQSCALTHLSEFDILVPVERPREPVNNIGPPPAEEELGYIDAPMEPIQCQPIALDPPLQCSRAYGVSIRVWDMSQKPMFY
jgi:hypothetical protein